MNYLRFTAALLIAFSVGQVYGETPPGFHKIEIGERAPDFKLPGIDGRDWTLADFKESKVLMVYFTSNHCPVCHAHDPRLMALLKELKGKDLAVVAINPNSGDGLRIDELGYSKYDDSFEHMKLYARDEGFTFPYLYDGDTQAVAKKFGCLATPHVFLFDQDRKLRYQGSFDDSRYPDAATVKKQHTRDAVLAMLDDKPVAVPTTRPFGCSTKWREKISAVAKDNESWAKADVTLDDIDADGLAALVKNSTDKFRLFNVWSTTCQPCVEEFPGLISVSRRMGLRKFELITITTDLPKDRERALAFLDKQRAALPKRLQSIPQIRRPQQQQLSLHRPQHGFIDRSLRSQMARPPTPHSVGRPRRKNRLPPQRQDRRRRTARRSPKRNDHRLSTEISWSLSVLVVVTRLARRPAGCEGDVSSRCNAQATRDKMKCKR